MMGLDHASVDIIDEKSQDVTYDGVTYYSSLQNKDAKIVETFDISKLKVDSEGYYNLTYKTNIYSNMYFRVRGTSSNLVDENGDPIKHEREVALSIQFRHDQINDYNYTNLSFYANTIWVNVN